MDDKQQSSSPERTREQQPRAARKSSCSPQAEEEASTEGLRRPPAAATGLLVTIAGEEEAQADDKEEAAAAAAAAEEEAGQVEQVSGELVGEQLSNLILREALEKVNWMMMLMDGTQVSKEHSVAGSLSERPEGGEIESSESEVARKQLEGISTTEVALEGRRAQEEEEDDYGQIMELHLESRSAERKTAARMSSDASFTSAALTIISNEEPPSPISPSPRSEFAEQPSSPAEGSQAEKEDSSRDGRSGSGSEPEEEEDFCGEMASSSTLRRIKLSTFEDVMVCEQNRESLESARRLFDGLAKRQQLLLKQQDAFAPPKNPPNRKESVAKNKKSSSLSSEEGVCASSSSSSRASSELEDPYDTVKIIRRSLSSASSATNFRQTLVCSVSPTSQLGGSHSDLAQQQLAGGSRSLSRVTTADNKTILEHQLYPMDGDEILQCRAAFRENKRLIEEQQERANRIQLGLQLSRSSSNVNQQPVAGGLLAARNHKQNQRELYCSNQRLNSRIESQHQTCSHCKQRLYPVDKMDLDFTKTTLNIHRNCFKCFVCSSMLRLETYAAMDAKLYCPAHVKCVAPSR